jgi:hypothetical protein
MKRLILAATLAIAVPAFAQDAAAPPADAAAPAAAPADTAAPAATPDTSPPAAAPAAASTDLPVCSAKVTDRCIEKGSAPKKTWKKKKK